MTSFCPKSILREAQASPIVYLEPNPQFEPAGNTMETLIYAANILYLLSYMVRDMLYLRVLTIVAACCLVIYFYNLAEPLMTVIYWNLFFIALNVLQLMHILRERYRTRANVQHQTAESAVYATWSI